MLKRYQHRCGSVEGIEDQFSVLLNDNEVKLKISSLTTILALSEEQDSYCTVGFGDQFQEITQNIIYKASPLCVCSCINMTVF